MLTVAENCICSNQGCDNHNAANLLGLRVEFEEGGHRESVGLFGDTLRVRLDLSKMDEHPYKAGSRTTRLYKADRIVPLVVECLKLNAARRWPRVRYLALSVVGVEAYAEHSGVFSLEGLQR
jgi:hypothetical protein